MTLGLLAALALYILAIVTTLLLTISSKKERRKSATIVLTVHFSLLLLFLFSLLLYNHSLQSILFLLFFCSGIVSAGLVLRSGRSVLLKIYTGLYIASVVYFLISPSGMVKLLTFSYGHEQNSRFHLESNYYIEEEQSLLDKPGKETTYKITRLFGVFHKTLARNISFHNRLDSIKLIQFDPENEVLLRGYYTLKSLKFENCDSIDVSVKLIKQSDRVIQKRNN